MTRSVPLRLVLASNNAKKLRELSGLFGDLAVELVRQGDLGIPEAEEPHITFLENALAKARHAAHLANGPALADDSGLCVDALAGAPGVISAHYGGQLPVGGDRETTRTHQDRLNNERLLRELEGVSDRSARFVCVLVAVRHAQDPEPLVSWGRWRGQILDAPRGDGGFGYDPLMGLPDRGCSVAELDAEEKSRLSHRALASVDMKRLLQDVWRVPAR